jgi:hypothetical protein
MHTLEKKKDVKISNINFYIRNLKIEEQIVKIIIEINEIKNRKSNGEKSMKPKAGSLRGSIKIINL